MAVLSPGASAPDRNSQSQEREKHFPLLVPLRDRKETILKGESRKPKVSPIPERPLTVTVRAKFLTKRTVFLLSGGHGLTVLIPGCFYPNPSSPPPTLLSPPLSPCSSHNLPSESLASWLKCPLWSLPPNLLICKL